MAEDGRGFIGYGDLAGIEVDIEMEKRKVSVTFTLKASDQKAGNHRTKYKLQFYTEFIKVLIQVVFGIPMELHRAKNALAG